MFDRMMGALVDHIVTIIVIGCIVCVVTFLYEINEVQKKIEERQAACAKKCYPYVWAETADDQRVCLCGND